MGHFDNTSLGLCFATVFLKMMSEVSLNEGTMFLTAIAALTTIIYNLKKIHSQWRKK